MVIWYLLMLRTKILSRRLLTSIRFECAVCLLIFLPIICYADSAHIGVYGVPANVTFQDPGLRSVFIAPNKENIQFYHDQKLKVFLTLNAFGGRSAWEKYPDSRPVTADGSLLSGSYGGVCPTHFEWRQDRLQLLEKWLQDYRGEAGISGVWLDFIRYPGSWEHPDVSFVDSCYCDRCLMLFQVEKGVTIPKGLSSSESSQWIYQNVASKWLLWKKEQITSFVREVRTLIDLHESGKKIKLGVFLVPWMQGEKNAAVTFLLGQDAKQISRYADILSPMVYHKMLKESPDWIRDITGYFSEITDRQVWPIIQAENTSAAEFEKTIDAVTYGGGDGILVYSYPKLKEGYLQLLTDFSKQEDFLAHESKSQRSCAPGKDYLFVGDFYRETIVPRSYPEVKLWGQSFLLNTHRVAGKFQNLRVHFTCTEEMAASALAPFEMTVPSSDQQFLIRNPHLFQKQTVSRKNRAKLSTDYFPVGAYGGSLSNLQQFKESGLNSSILGLSKEAVERCVELDMHCAFSLPRDVEKIKIMLDRAGPIPENGRFAFYVNDEPGIHSFPRWKAKDIDLLLKERYPGIPTMMAIVRPQIIPDYTQAADYFMLDQYPVPFMPMTWLSDSMEIAAKTVGKKRLYSIIQAFGGDKWKVHGWPRLPTFEEMNSLAFLSIIHGSRGIYFYKYQAAVATKEGKDAFERVISNIQQIQPWLTAEDDFVNVSVEMTSDNKFDPAGNPAIHCGEKQIDSGKLTICVNTIGTYVSANIPVPTNKQPLVQEISFKPFEVKLYTHIM